MLQGAAKRVGKEAGEQGELETHDISQYKEMAGKYMY